MEKTTATIVALAGLMGAAGVAAGAAAAHAGGGGNLQTASLYLLIHAAASLAIALGRLRGRIVTTAAILMTAGASLFGADLILRSLAGTRLFPMAAPAGGSLMILGWLVLAVAGAMAAGENRSNSQQ